MDDPELVLRIKYFLKILQLYSFAEFHDQMKDDSKNIFNNILCLVC